MDLLTLQEKIKELLLMFSFRVKQENISDRYDINRISETIMVPVLRLLYDYKKLRNLNYTDEKNYPGIDLADDEAKIAFQVTSTADNQKVKHTLEQIKKYHLDSKYDRFIVYILTSKKGKYSDKDYSQIDVDFIKDRDIWDYLDLSKKVSEIDDIAKLKKVFDYLESAIGRGQPFRHRPTENKTELIELNFIGVQVPEHLYSADINVDRSELVVRIKEKKFRPDFKISDRDVVCEYFDQNNYRYPKDFVCYENKIITFHDLNNDEHPFYAVINPKTITKVETNFFVDNECFDEGKERILKDLLRRCLVRILVPFDIKWHNEEKLFFFTFDQESENYPIIHNTDFNRYERKVRWKEKRSDERVVSFRRYPKDLPNETYYYFHLAFKIKFHLLNGEWFLEITPDWHATKDGYKNSFFKDGRRKRIQYLSELVKDKKEEEANQAVLNNFRFIRTFLKNIKTPLFNEAFIKFGKDIQLNSSPILEDKIWNPDYIEVEEGAETEQNKDDTPKRKKGRRRKKKVVPEVTKKQLNPLQNTLFD